MKKLLPTINQFLNYLSPVKLLLIEDEIELGKSIQQYLSTNDFMCEWVQTFVDAKERLALYQYECVILDLGLPDGHGFDLLTEIKKEKGHEGIIIISAKETVESRIEGLQLGADDYLVKPFHLAELQVRIQAIIRRHFFAGNNVIVHNEIEIDTLAKTVQAHGQSIDMTKSEYDLLLFLIANENKVLTKSTLAEHLSGAWADTMDNHDFIYAHIKNIKKKLKAAVADDYIKSVYGIGYKWTNE